MFVCSVNFSIYYLLLIKKPKEVFLNEELRYYVLIVLGAAVAITWYIHDRFDSIAVSFRHALFQVLTVTSTTGYNTTDFNVWPGFCRMLLVALMFMGACAGSTGGGFKVSRLVIVAKTVKNEIKSITHPRSVQRVRFEGKQLSGEVVHRVLVYLGAYVFIVVISVLLVSIHEEDFTTAFTAVMATFNNIGPGLDGVYSTFADCSILSKIVLMADMLIGRLEIFPMLVILTPGMWTMPVKKMIKKTK
jgi:trk system potassium uptake protein TrkH